MKNTQKLFAILLGLMLGLSLLTVSVLAALDSGGAPDGEGKVYRNISPSDFSNSPTDTSTPTPTPVTTPSGTNTATPTPTPGATPEPTPLPSDGRCGDNLVWSISGSGALLTIEGSGPMYDFAAGEAPWWNDYADTITEVVIGEGVTTVGGNAFSDCSGMTFVSLPYTMESVGEDAFAYCTGLETVHYRSPARSIEEGLEIASGGNGWLTEADCVNLYADVKEDEILNSGDLIRLMRSIVGDGEPGGPVKGDYTGDGRVDVLDLLVLTRLIP